MRKEETFGKKRNDEKKRASERRIVGNALRKSVAAGLGRCAALLNVRETLL